MPKTLRNISVNFTLSNLQNTYSRKGLTLYAYSMKLYVTEMPKNIGQQTTNIQLFIAQIQSFAEGVSKTTKHKVLDLKQLKQSYSVVIQSKLLDISLENHIWYFAHKIFCFPWEEIVQCGNTGNGVSSPKFCGRSKLRHQQNK